MRQKRKYASYRGAIADPEAPVNGVVPSIVGDAVEGATLAAVAGEWTGSPAPSITRHWLADGREIHGAIGATLLITAAEVGKAVSILESATNVVGRARVASAATARIAPASAPENTGPPTISGTAQVGQTLSADDGEWSGAPEPLLSRQWEGDGEPIEGETGDTYEPIEADIGKVITITVTATNAAGSVSQTSAPTDAVIDA